MSKKLFLIRHAEAVLPGSGTKDFDRPLTANGHRDATHLGLYLSDTSIIPDVLLSSTSLRTRETTEAITNQIKFSDNQVQYEDALYEPTVRDMLGLVNELPESANIVLIISHNPAITYLAEYLSGAEIGNMSPASMVEVEFDGAWSEVSQNSGSFKSHILADKI